MKVAAYQAPLRIIGSWEILNLIREQVERCESEGVEILCCPEGVVGGLADYSSNPHEIAIDVEGGQLDKLLTPLASNSVTTILGFTELAACGRLYNSAAIFHKGTVVGIYRKLHPAINKSVYEAGDEVPVFTISNLTFGIIICNDSNYSEPARIMASKGAKVLFVPTNNGLPPAKGGPELIGQVRNVDVKRAIDNNVWVVRADVAGYTEGLTSYGSSGIVSPAGVVHKTAKQLETDLIVADLPFAHKRCTDD